jgi:hypothetical protein
MTMRRLFAMPAATAATERHRRDTRPGLGSGRAVAAVVAVLLAWSVAPSAGAVPADAIINLLHLGSRPDLGLGGDPFLSPAARQTGWWRQDVLDEPSDLRVRSDQHRPVTRRLSGGDTEFQYVATTVEGRQALSAWDRTFRLGVSLSSVRATAASDGDMSSIGWSDDGASATVVARLENLVRGLDLQAEAPILSSSSRHGGDVASYGFHFSPATFLQWSSRWSTRHDGNTLDAELDGELVISPLNLRADAVEHRGRVRLPGGFAFEAGITESDYREDAELASSDYEFLPTAWSMSRQQSLEWEHRRGWRALVRHSDLAMTVEGAGYWEGQRYLRLSHTDAAVESYLAALQIPVGARSRLVIDAETAEFDAFARIDVDSWRFASWEVAWLGAKKVVQLDGAGRWRRYHVGYDGPWGAWSLGAGVTWYDIRPDAYSESWIRIPFARPQDYEKTTLGTPRLDLGAVSMRAERVFGSTLVAAELHQFVYANDHGGEGGGDGDIPDPDPDPDPGAPDDVGGWFGGTYATVSVGFRFH